MKVFVLWRAPKPEYGAPEIERAYADEQRAKEDLALLKATSQSPVEAGEWYLTPTEFFGELAPKRRAQPEKPLPTTAPSVARK